MDGRQRLRERLQRPEPILIGGAHDGMSALLVQEAGFDAIWASGFEISAAHGMPDANILTMTDTLAAAAAMAQAADIPVIADCDNGFGNAINVIHTVRSYEREGMAGMCFEDNIFPKRCSFYAGVKRELATIEEHAGKVRACIDTRKSDDFVIIARTEALIAGWGMEEALKRGRAYADAGADFVLVHSKSADPDEVLGFAKHWDRDTPLVCVPTIYKTTTAKTLSEGGYRMVIYANHGLRSAVKAMRETFSTLVAEQHASAVDDRVVPLQDIYDLIGVPEMKAQEKAYMPAGGVDVGAIVLAAGASPELGDLTKDRPKAMLDIKGKPLLGRQVDALNSAGIKDISVVVGYQKDAVDLPNLKLYAADGSRGELASLMEAAAELNRRTIVTYGDILFDGEIVERLLQTQGDIVLVVDRAGSSGRENRDLVRTTSSGANGRALGQRTDRLEAIAQDLADANGEWIGMLMLSSTGAAALKEIYESLAHKGEPVHQAASFEEAALTDLLHEVLERGLQVECIDTYKGWMEVDTFDDYRAAWSQMA